MHPTEKGVALKGCVYRLIFAHLNPLNLCEQDQRHKNVPPKNGDSTQTSPGCDRPIQSHSGKND